MKIAIKTLASLTISSLALMLVPLSAFAESTVPPRLAGTTAAKTAAAIAEQTGWTGTAILASSTSSGMVDALTAGPLASYLEAPILLTGAGALDSDTKAELTELAVKTVYVTSGTAVISQTVLNELTDTGLTVIPLGGADKYETSVNIAKRMTGVTKVAVVNGLQDALSIAAIASAANEPILLTDKDSLPACVAAYLAENPGITSSDVIGGTGVISENVKALLPNATRHAGKTAYDTNHQVIQDFDASLTYGNLYLANGETGIDALAGAPLAAQTRSAIVLTDGTLPAAATFVKDKLADGSFVTAIGGEAVVPETLRAGLTAGRADANATVNDWAVKVNGESILARDFEARLASAQEVMEKQGMRFEGDEGREALSQMKSQLLERMIEMKLLSQEVTKKQLNPDDPAVKSQAEELKKMMGNEIIFQETLAQQGMTELEFKNSLVLYSKITAGVEVSDKEVKTFYEENPDDFGQPESVTARHILLKSEAEAKEVIAQLKAGADFATLAREKSIDPSAKDSGGYLGSFTKGQMVPEFESAAFAQKAGTFSESPVKTEFGYHVILVEAHTEAAVPDYNEVKAQAEQLLLSQVKDAKFTAFWNDLRRQATIEYAPGYNPPNDN